LKFPNKIDNFIKQTISAKVFSLKGDSPDWEIKYLKISNFKDVKLVSLRGKLGSSYPLKKA